MADLLYKQQSRKQPPILCIYSCKTWYYFVKISVQNKTLSPSMFLSVQKSVDINAQCADGRTALDIAIVEGSDPICHILISHGAKRGVLSSPGTTYDDSELSDSECSSHSEESDDSDVVYQKKTTNIVSPKSSKFSVSGDPTNIEAFKRKHKKYHVDYRLQKFPQHQYYRLSVFRTIILHQKKLKLSVKQRK